LDQIEKKDQFSTSLDSTEDGDRTALEEFLGAALRNGDFFRECRAQAHQSAKVH
jgi:hypothetical protein